MEMENGRQVIGLYNDFSVGGNKLHIIRVENGEAVLEDVKTGRKALTVFRRLNALSENAGTQLKKNYWRAEHETAF